MANDFDRVVIFFHFGVFREPIVFVMRCRRDEEQVERDDQLSVDALKRCVEKYKQIYEQEIKRAFPQSPTEQLQLAIAAVFGSWNNQRAVRIGTTTVDGWS